jgi:translation elongation factor EF-1alpha
MSAKLIGTITHYYDKIGVAVIDLQGPLKVGDTVHIFGRNTDFHQEVQSIQIEHKPIQEAGPGQEIASKVIQRVRSRDKVYVIPAVE